jgi:hypothetical protein
MSKRRTHSPGDSEQWPGFRLSEVSGRLRWLRLLGGRGCSATAAHRGVGRASGDPGAVGLAQGHPPACRFHCRPVPACRWIRPARRGPCWRLQRPEAHMPADRQLYPRPRAAEAGSHLPRQRRRWGGLRIAAVSLSAWVNPAEGPPPGHEARQCCSIPYLLLGLT